MGMVSVLPETPSVVFDYPDLEISNRSSSSYQLEIECLQSAVSLATDLKVYGRTATSIPKLTSRPMATAMRRGHGQPAHW